MGVSFRNATTAAGVDPLVFTKPTGTVSDDVLVAVIYGLGTITPPAGFVNVPTGHARLRIYRKVAGGSEPADYSFDVGGNFFSGVLSAWIGMVPTGGTNPLINVGALTEGTDGSCESASITIKDYESMLLYCLGADTGQAFGVTPPGGMTEAGEVSAGNGTLAEVAYEARDPGATGGRTGTLTGGVPPIGGWATVQVELQPAVMEATLQGVATLDPQGSLQAGGEAAFQGVATLDPQGSLQAGGEATLQGVARITAEAFGIPALDFTVYDLYVDDGTNVIGYIVHEDAETKSSDRSNPVRADKQDVGQNPFELRPEFGDPFAQGDFSHGAGQDYFHHVGRDEKKFLASEGLDISEPGVLTHLAELAEGHNSTTVGAMTQAVDVIFIADGTTVKRGNGAFPGVWTTDDPHNAEGATTVEDLTSRGDEVFAALGVNGVHIRSSAGVWDHFQPDAATDLVVGTATRVAWLKDRLMVVGTAGREIFEVVADSTPTAIKTLPEGWTFESIFEAGAFLYAPAVNADAGLSRVHIIGLNDAGSALEDKGSVPIPRGELIYTGLGDVGQVFLGGGKANNAGGYDPVFYQAFQNDNGFLQLLRIAEGDAGANDCSVLAFETLGDEIVLSWSEGSGALTGARSGIALYDKGREAFSHHLKKTGATSDQVQDILFYKGRLVLSIEGDGLFYEDLGTLVSEAYLISSVGDWGSAGLKVWDLLEVAHKALPPGTKVAVDYSTKHPEEDDWNEAISNSVADSLGADNRLSNLKSRLFAVKLRSFAAAGGATAPEIQSFTVRSNSTRPHPEYILTRFLRLLAKDRKDKRGTVVYQNPVTRKIALQILLDSWVTVYEPGITWTAYVKDVSTVEPAEPFLSATNGEPLKEAYLLRLDMVATGEAS